MNSGAIAQVMCGRMLPDTQNDLGLYGSDGRFATKETIWEARLGEAQMVTASGDETQSYEYNYLANFVDELNDFGDALQHDRASRRHRPGRPPRRANHLRRHRVGQDRPHRPGPEQYHTTAESHQQIHQHGRQIMTTTKTQPRPRVPFLTAPIGNGATTTPSLAIQSKSPQLALTGPASASAASVPHEHCHTTISGSHWPGLSQFRPDDRVSMPLTSHSSAPTTRFGGFG